MDLSPQLYSNLQIVISYLHLDNPLLPETSFEPKLRPNFHRNQIPVPNFSVAMIGVIIAPVMWALSLCVILGFFWPFAFHH